jgi:hypothetical protein
MYSDPSGGLQEHLGMTLRTLDPGSDADKGYARLSGIDPAAADSPPLLIREYQQMSMFKNGFLSAAVGFNGSEHQADSMTD